MIQRLGQRQIQPRNDEGMPGKNRTKGVQEMPGLALLKNSHFMTTASGPDKWLAN